MTPPIRTRKIKYGDIITGQRDTDSFYLVDLPGFGYAAVPDYQRRQWLEFLQQYLSNRGPTLKVVFHLIDSRHGPTAEDATMLRAAVAAAAAAAASSAAVGTTTTDTKYRYVIGLTKADKNVKIGGGGKNEQSRQQQSKATTATTKPTGQSEQERHGSCQNNFARVWNGQDNDEYSDYSDVGGNQTRSR